MGAVAVGALLAAALVAIVALMVWQAARRSGVDDPAEYLVPEAARFVYERLSDRALESLDLDDVNLLLEWQVHYHQVVAPRVGKERPIVGSGDSIEYLMERSAESGRSVDVLDIAEVIAADTEYLVSIGAVGEAVNQ
ncbi:MAG: hypothetical protein WD652_04170 [Acidimicrobiia bacterium]